MCLIHAKQEAHAMDGRSALAWICFCQMGGRRLNTSKQPLAEDGILECTGSIEFINISTIGSESKFINGRYIFPGAHYLLVRELHGKPGALVHCLF